MSKKQQQKTGRRQGKKPARAPRFTGTPAQRQLKQLITRILSR